MKRGTIKYADISRQRHYAEDYREDYTKIYQYITCGTKKILLLDVHSSKKWSRAALSKYRADFTIGASCVASATEVCKYDLDNACENNVV